MGHGNNLDTFALAAIEQNERVSWKHVSPNQPDLDRPPFGMFRRPADTQINLAQKTSRCVRTSNRVPVERGLHFFSRLGVKLEMFTFLQDASQA